MVNYDKVAGVDSLYNFPPEVISAIVLAESMRTNYVQFRTTTPNPTLVKAYVDVSVIPPVFKVYDGTAWVSLSSGNGSTVVTPPVITPTTDTVILTENGDSLTTESGDFFLITTDTVITVENLVLTESGDTLTLETSESLLVSS